MTRYRKKPVEVNAIQWSGKLEDAEKIMEFFDGEPVGFNGRNLVIYTREGMMVGSPNDWIIRGTAGEFYPCKPDIFAEIYEEVE